MFLIFNIHNLSVNIYNIYRSLLCPKQETSNAAKCLETAFYIPVPHFYFNLNNI